MKKFLTALFASLFLAVSAPVAANEPVANENASDQGQQMSSEKAQKGKKNKKKRKSRKKAKKVKKAKKAKVPAETTQVEESEPVVE